MASYLIYEPEMLLLTDLVYPGTHTNVQLSCESLYDCMQSPDLSIAGPRQCAEGYVLRA